MSDLAVWLTDTAAGRGIVRVWAPARLADVRGRLPALAHRRTPLN